MQIKTTIHEHARSSKNRLRPNHALVRPTEKAATGGEVSLEPWHCRADLIIWYNDFIFHWSFIIHQLLWAAIPWTTIVFLSVTLNASVLLSGAERSGNRWTQQESGLSYRLWFYPAKGRKWRKRPRRASLLFLFTLHLTAAAGESLSYSMLLAFLCFCLGAICSSVTQLEQQQIGFSQTRSKIS